MNQLLEYKCCFCGKEGQVMYEMPDDPRIAARVRETIDLSKADLACQSCTDFERRKNRTRLIILDRCHFFSGLNKTDRSELENDFRKSMSLLLHRYCYCFEKRFGLPSLFEPSMVDAVVARPSHAASVLARITNLARERVVR